MYRFSVIILLSAPIFHLVHCGIYRLQKNVKPTRYILTMEPHLELNVLEPVPYNGSIIMELEVLENTKSITFHKKSLEIDSSSIAIISSNGEKVKVRGTSENKETETYTVKFVNELLKGGSYKLKIDNFFGYLTQHVGFVLIRYWADNGKLRGSAITHFEPTDARLAFPCFDEPAIKASFIIKLIRRKGDTSVSNEELQSTENMGNGRFKDTFRETPIMSTFLVAFAVTDFKPTRKAERIRIFAQPRAADDVEKNMSIVAAVKILKALEEYMGINFTISKMDAFAVPFDSFQDSAMENWGLITFSERNVFCNPLYYEIAQQSHKRCTTTIAHEFTHQWFGNLVTAEWWDYLWLGESFAAYFEYYITSIIQPSWRMMDQFVVDTVQESFRSEEFISTHPLTFPIRSSGERPPTHIIYDKGSSLLRMMEHFLTPKVFKKGLQIYLQNKQFSSAVPLDLYDALQEAVDRAGVNHLLNNLKVAEVFGTWEHNAGFAIVTVTRNYTTGSITIQEESITNETVNWNIPINYVFSADKKTNFSKTTADYWLSEKSVTINRNFPTDGWLVVNKQQTGYYRVNYDSENWERIIQFMNSDNFTSIHVLNRAQLIDDAFNLAHNKKIIPIDAPLRLSEYLIRERDYIPWAAFCNAVSWYMSVYNTTRHTTDYQIEYFKNYALKNANLRNLDEYGVYRIYTKQLTGGLLDHLNTIDEADVSFLDILNHNQIYNKFGYY